MTANELREKYIKFFVSKGHAQIQGKSLLPENDPTVLFTTAGMHPLVPYLLGEPHPAGVRLVDYQKCIRTGDIECVGDESHLTFFEMLGNWSFGDYYKEDAIKWAWELLTEVWKLPKDRLFATIHTSDDEAERVWKTQTDIPHNRIMRFGDASNFWEMGETGPCGPCSEIHYDTGDESTRETTYNDPVEGVNGQNARYRELWNLVFIQYNREKDGALNPLPQKHVDTGMGFERVAAVIQGVDSNYDTDLFQPIIKELEKASGIPYSGGPEGAPFRVIADHIRALAFAITDGAFPSNEGRGYVLRRLLRRAYRFGREIGFKEPFLWKLTATLIANMGGAFPEIGERRAYLEEVIRSEEERFGATLEQGIEKFGAMAAAAASEGAKSLSGADVFALYDTYGFPADLTRLMAEEKGLGVNEAEYDELMKKQRERARTARKNAADDGLSPEGWTELRTAAGTEFTGYEKTSDTVSVCRYKMIDDNDGVYTYLFILNKTPFYAESGGQVGDAGELTAPSGIKITVESVFKWNDLVVHRVCSAAPLTDDVLKREPLTAAINTAPRDAVRKNHTATHLLQSALRRVLGGHVQQSGSRVDQDGLRFDFTHFKALDDGEIVKVETLVNEWIMDNFPVETAVMDTAAAKAGGATALFGEKYADAVRVVSIGGYASGVSKELCGGTHVSATGEIGPFHIVGEESVSAGVRRVTAITGMAAVKRLIEKERAASALAAVLKVGQDKIHDRVAGLLDAVKDLESKLKKLSAAGASDAVGAIFAEAGECASDLKFAVKDLGETDKDSLVSVADAVSDKIAGDGLLNTVIVIAAAVDGKAMFAAGAGNGAVSDYGIHCGDLVKAAAKVAGGGGGGSKTRAQAGGKDAALIPAALSEARGVIVAKTVAAKRSPADVS